MSLLPFQEATKIPEEVQQEINKLHPSNKLFGSRWMSPDYLYNDMITDNTDWDFAIPYEGNEYEECRRAKSLGWVREHTENYKDKLHFITWEKYIGSHKVQMCSKINLALFIQVFYGIEPEFYWRYLHKSSPECLPKTTQTDIFDQLYKTAGW